MEDLAPGIPTDLAKKYRLPSQIVEPNSDIFGKSIQEQEDGSLYVELALSSASAAAILMVRRDETISNLNSGTALQPGNVYAFELAYQAQEQLNLRFNGTVTLNYVRVLYRRWV